MWKRNIRSRLIARCFGFPFHNFLTGSDTQVLTGSDTQSLGFWLIPEIGL